MASALAKEDRRVEIFNLVAYLGRYGHQQASQVLEMPITDVMLLARSVGQLISEEADAHRRAMETDG